MSFSGGAQAMVELTRFGAWAADEVKPLKVSTVEDIEALLEEQPEDGMHTEGPLFGGPTTTTLEWGSAEWRDPFAKPDFFNDETKFRLTRSIKAGRRTIRSAWFIHAQQTSTLGSGRDNVLVSVPVRLFKRETEDRYYTDVQPEMSLRQVVARAVLETSLGIEQPNAPTALARDKKLHREYVNENSNLFGEEARKADELGISAVGKDFDDFYAQTKLSPLENPVEFMEWFQSHRTKANGSL